MLNQESQTMHSSMLTSSVGNMIAVEADNTPEREETLRRADEALRRANQWVEWMETLNCPV
ncbi:MAG: hypothetical protein V3R87_06785 [Dehalococcoidia bacterium]